MSYFNEFYLWYQLGVLTAVHSQYPPRFCFPVNKMEINKILTSEIVSSYEIHILKLSYMFWLWKIYFNKLDSGFILYFPRGREAKGMEIPCFSQALLFYKLLLHSCLFKKEWDENFKVIVRKKNYNKNFKWLIKKILKEKSFIHKSQSNSVILSLH